jgi:TM2 domain-containing membrane protein YozV
LGERRFGYQERQQSSNEEHTMKSSILWLIAAILVIIGIVQLIQGQIILAIVLFVVAALVGPGGYSIFQRRSA